MWLSAKELESAIALLEKKVADSNVDGATHTTLVEAIRTIVGAEPTGGHTTLDQVVQEMMDRCKGWVRTAYDMLDKMKSAQEVIADIMKGIKEVEVNVPKTAFECPASGDPKETIEAVTKYIDEIHELTKVKQSPAVSFESLKQACSGIVRSCIRKKIEDAKDIMTKAEPGCVAWATRRDVECSRSSPEDIMHTYHHQHVPPHIDKHRTAPRSEKKPATVPNALDSNQPTKRQRSTPTSASGQPFTSTLPPHSSFTSRSGSSHNTFGFPPHR